MISADPVRGVAKNSEAGWISGLALLRGVCAISILAYHYLHIAKVATLHSMGTFGVYIFFILSGYTLQHVYCSRLSSMDDLRGFFISRFFRIVPLYATLVLLQTIFMGRNHLYEILLNVTLLFGLSNPLLVAGTPGGWSIGIEAVFYLTFPLFMTFRSLKPLLVLFVITVILNVEYAKFTFSDPLMSQHQPIFYTQAPTFICYFIGGMILRRANLDVSRVPFRILFSFGLLVLVFCVPHYLGLSRQDILASNVTYFLIFVSGLSVLLAAGPLNTPIHSRLGDLLGDLSYSVYLLHYPVATLMLRTFAFPMWAELSIAAALTFAFSYMSFRWIESPARRWGRNWIYRG